MALPPIPLASVVPGPRSSPENKGVNELYFGFVDAEDGRHQCYIKVLPEKQLVNELAAWVLGRAMKFPVLDGFLLRARDDDIPQSKLLPNLLHDSSGEALVFGSKAVGYPQLGRTLNDNPDWATYFLEPNVFPRWQELIVYDDWIANGDRHGGNLLLTPENKLFWIDHSHAFAGANWDCTKWDAKKLYGNQVAKGLMSSLEKSDKTDLVKKAAELAMFIGKLPLQNLQAASQIIRFLTTSERDELALFVTERAQHLELMCAKRVQIPTTLRLVT